MSTIIELRQGELDLDPVVAERCEERLTLARTHMAAGFYHWLEAGKQFAAIKNDLGSRHWAPWLREHKIALRHPEYLITIAERFDPILAPNAGMDQSEVLIDMNALKLLACSDVPVIAAEQAVTLAADGERITKAKAEELIEAARIDAAKQALAAATAENRNKLAAELAALQAIEAGFRRRDTLGNI